MPPPPPLGLDAARRLLNRAGYGPRPGELAAAARLALPDWLERQLALPAEEPAVAAHLAGLTLPVRYVAGPGEQMVDEQRGLDSLAQPAAYRWALADFRRPIPFAERERPRVETVAATIARKSVVEAVLRERMVEFWHDHFAVSTQAGAFVFAMLPDHDRLIRAHALGNFTALLEASATSPAMLAYLNNRSSRAGAPNENYARELMELHTLGRDAYAAGARTWREIPGAAEGRPQGYHDGDVWEAARAFTGWTLAAGQRVDAGLTLPASGAFAYVEKWHDGYQKRVLGQELPPFAPAMADGRQVLAACARHPATARHLCTKLARFLIGDPPPPAAVARGIAAFARHAEAADQIARTLRAMLDGPEILGPAAGRVRRPLDAVAAASRALGIRLAPTPPLMSNMLLAGQLPFAWPAPDGQPVAGDTYLGATALRARWGLLSALAINAWGTGASTLYAGLIGQEVRDAALALAAPMLDARAARPVADTIAATWARRGGAPRIATTGEAAGIAGWLLCAPAFQTT